MIEFEVDSCSMKRSLIQLNQMMTVFGHSKAQNCSVIDHMCRPVVETHGCEESVLDVARRVAFEVAERDRRIRV